ncbi:MAG: hypothetical protein JWM33_143, partial [Caulobacteraceae bacterium]|nr:hypothetical protein [Caulobacteraceae bacterium]
PQVWEQPMIHFMKLRRQVARRLILAPALLMLAAASARAAEPPPADPLKRLPTEVAGVLGSGSNLSLSLFSTWGSRRLSIGDEYQDGWKLTALTPSAASLTRNGETRQVGLNPTGALASSEVAPPSSVTIAGLPDEKTILAYVDRRLKEEPFVLTGSSLRYLTPQEQRRNLAYIGMMSDERARRAPDELGQAEMRAFLGQAAWDDFIALSQKATEGQLRDQIADLAARPVTGPTTYYVPPGSNAAAIAQTLGVDRRGLWNDSRDAQGGVTSVLVAGTAETFTPMVTLPDGHLATSIPGQRGRPALVSVNSPVSSPAAAP